MNLEDVFRGSDTAFLRQSLAKYDGLGNTETVKVIKTELQRRTETAPVHVSSDWSCGELRVHKVRMDDDTGRVATMHSGDPFEFLRPFVPEQSQIVRICRENFTGANSPQAKAAAAADARALEAGRRVIAAKDGDSFV